MTIKENKNNSLFDTFISVEDMKDNKDSRSMAMTSRNTVNRDKRLSNTALSNFLNSNVDDRS